MTDKCYICEKNEAEGNCDRCGEPICFDCSVKMTIHNQIDYPLCEICGEVNNEVKAAHYQEEEERKEAEIEEKKAKSLKRYINYHKPENIEKRRIKKAERKRFKRERESQMWQEAAKIVNQMSRGL